ncbi:MAG: NAD-dependent epimerase/dehydratase family protein [Thermoplasmatales archaeon]
MLITGGNGFLRYHLSKKGVSDGIDVTVLDDLSILDTVKFSSDIMFIKERVEESMIYGRFDYIFHLAAKPSPEGYVSNPLETLLSNSIGTLKMLKLAHKFNLRFIYPSSSQVYGDARVIPTLGSYYGYVNPNGIRSCCYEGKRYSEVLIIAFHRKFNLDTRIQRPFNVYGPGIRPDGQYGQYGRVIPRFLQQTISGNDITIH